MVIYANEPYFWLSPSVRLALTESVWLVPNTFDDEGWYCNV